MSNPTRVLVIDGKGVRIPPGYYDRIAVKPGSEILPTEPGEPLAECGDFIVLPNTKENPTIIGRNGQHVEVKAAKFTVPFPERGRRRGYPKKM